ncbi:hypothetical protein ACFE04_005798 [Oxalis oulophora]
MASLRSTYAEILLNTAKEAAAKIIASEKKAVRFQHDLCCTKDESLRMLLRLKQMMDTKAIEAEMTSLTQSKKIDELEAQLHEAEDIITDLRSELEWFRNKLKMQDNQPQFSAEQTVNPDTTYNGIATPQEIPIPPSKLALKATLLTSDMKITFLNERVVDGIFCNTSETKAEQNIASDFGKLSVQKSDLPSIFVRSKEPGQYRNGCTQRIRALDRNFNPEDANNPQSSSKRESVVEMNDKDVPSPNIKNLDLMNKSAKELFVKSCQASFFLSRCTAGSVNGQVGLDSAHILSSNKDDHVDKVKTNGNTEEEILHKSTFSNNENKLTDDKLICCNHNSSSACVVPDCKDQLKSAESESKMKPLHRLNPGLTLIKSNGDSKLGLKNISDGLKVPSQSTILQQAANAITEPRHESTLENKKIITAKNPKVSCSDQNELKPLEGAGKSPCKGESGKFLKYTFKRKRKKESLNDPDDNTYAEASAMKRRAEQKQDVVLVKQKSNSVDESSRSSTQLPLVTHQVLI